MKTLCAIVLLSLLFSDTFANTLTRNTAYQKAQDWFSKNSFHSKSHKTKQIATKEYHPTSRTYCFTQEDAFVFIGGSEEEPRILGYGNSDAEVIPQNVISLIDAMDKTLQFIKQTSPSLNGIQAFTPHPPTPIEPFVHIIRKQEEPFNASCPIYKHSNGTEDKTIVGCVATALEQVISYYKYPAQLLDTLYGWKTSHYSIDTIMPGTIIDHEHILHQYNSGEYNDINVKAVADLSYYCGIAAHMKWGVTASGASIDNLPPVLEKAFGYKYVRHLFSSSFNAENWHKLIYEELLNHRPVLYAGYNTTMAGHAFIVDGINTEGMYHILWGYGGEYDGYFDLNILNTYEDPRETTPNGQLFGCYCNQEILLLNPEDVEYTINDTLTSVQRLRIDSVCFTRQPDLCKYVTAKIHVTNTSDEYLKSSLILVTTSTEEEITEDNLDVITLAGTDIAPHCSECLTAYCTFMQPGTRILAGLTDNSSLIILDTIMVAYSKSPKVNVDIHTPKPSSESVVLNVTFTNTSHDYWSGNNIIYCLYEGEYNKESLGMQHYTVLNLKPDGVYTDSVMFGHLKPDTKYTILVRNTWAEFFSTQFYTTELNSIKVPIILRNNKKEYYDLNGIKLSQEPHKGLYIIKDSNKTLKLYRK